MKGFEETLDKMLKTFKAKNTDYAGKGDPFRNFKLCEQLGICSVEQGIMVRMSDKMSRISNLLTNEAQVKSESIYDTLEDLSVYSIILKCYLEQKKGGE
jgi:hypothetical protein